MTAKPGSDLAVVCRGCGAQEAELVLDLGRVPASDLFPAADSDPAEDPAWPLELYLCGRCRLVQLGPQRHPEPEPPRAVESATALAHAAQSAAAIVAIEGLRPGQSVIEIDSHHGGSWLAGFTTAGLVQQPTDGTADLVADVHGLAHEADLSEPLARHAARLRPGGKLVLEFHHLLPMVEQGQIDTVRHGHFVYLSLTTMAELLNQHGLVATRATRVPVFGGSLRLTAGLIADDPEIDPSVAEVLDAERTAGLLDARTYTRFGERGRHAATAFRAHLEQARADGRTVAGYGAPSKAPVLVALAGVDEDLLPYTADLAPAKHGRRLPGGRIPIVSPETLAERRPDEVIILTWDIADEVATQLRSAAPEWRPALFVPLPDARYLPDADTAPDAALSVIIPVLNPGPRFVEQLDALSRQTFSEPWELIVADNGTTDGSLAALDDWAGKLTIRVIKADDKPGPAHARNVAARYARGPWLVFCDSDDVVDPDWLAQLYAARTSGDLIAGKNDVRRLNSAASISARGGDQYWTGLLAGPQGFLKFGQTSNLMIGRDYFFKLGGFDGSPNGGKDVDLSWRVQLAGGTLVLAPAAVVHYRLRDGFRPIFRQSRAYARGEAALYRRYKAQGLQPIGAKQLSRQGWWLVSRLPFVFRDEVLRYRWAYAAGNLIGALKGKLEAGASAEFESELDRLPEAS